MKKICSLMLLSLILLSSCATPVRDTNILRSSSKIKQNDGFVIAEVINNSLHITGPIKHWEELIVWRVSSEGKKKDETLSISALPNASSSFLFAGSLPTGTYKIGLLWTKLDMSDVIYYARAYVPPMIGTFEVKAGQVTNLGTIIYHPLNVKNWSDTLMPDYVMTRNKSVALMSKIININPSLTEKINTQSKELTWNNDDFDEQRNSAVKLIEKTPIITDLFLTKEYEFVMTGKFGTLISNKHDKTFTHNLATNKHILSFSARPDGQWLVGGEYGLLLTAKEPYDDWQKIKVNNLLEHVVDIGTNDNGITYVMTSDGNNYSLYLYEKNQLRLIKEFKGKNNFLFEVTKISQETIINNNYIKVYLKSKIYAFNLKTMAWESINEGSFGSLVRQGNGVLIGKPYSSLFAKLPVYSLDEGKTWSKIINSNKKLFGTATVPTYISRDKKFLTTSMDIKFGFWGGKKEKSKNTLVLISEDNASTWKTTGKLPKYCLSIEAQVSKDDAIYLRCDNGDIHLTNDFGKNWKLAFNANIVDSTEFPKELKLEFSKFKKK